MNPSQDDPNAILQAAQAAVRDRNHPVAVAHLAKLIPQFATHPVVTGLLDELVATAPNPLQLVSLQAMDYGTGAVHTYAIGRSGYPGEAYTILSQLARSTPANGIIDWALPWLDAGQLSDEQRDGAAFLYFLSAHHRFGNRRELAPEATAVVKQWLPHLRTAMTKKPYDDMSYTAYTIALRQAGEMDEAVRVCGERHKAIGSYQSAVSLASTLREAKRFDEWLAAELEILRLEPDDVHTRLDLGDCFWEEQEEKLAEAEEWYSDALRLDPNQPWAVPSLLAVRHQRTGDPKWRDDLEDYADSHPDNERAAVCLGRVTPFFGDFLYPADGSINNLSDIANQIEELLASGSTEPVTGRIKSSTTGLDVPSCQRSIDRQVERWGGGVRIEREILGVQKPDPREPRVPVRVRLWEYDGTTPRPAVPPAPPEVAEPVARLAQVRYDLGVWVGYAAQIGGQLGPGAVPGLLGVMANPPEPPEGWRMWDWTARVQVAAALIVAGTGGEALDVLTDLANGPLDWTTGAAVVALTVIGRSRPEYAPRVRQLLTELHRDLPRPGADYYDNIILNCHLRLPGVPPEERATVREHRAKCEARFRKPMTNAELAAGVFLARPVPPDTTTIDVIRLVIEAYTLPGGRDHPNYAASVATALMLSESFAAGAEGDAKGYLDEQTRVLRLVQDEFAKARPTG